MALLYLEIRTLLTIDETEPTLTRGTYTAIEDIQPIITLIVAPVKSGWPVKPGIGVVNLNEAGEKCPGKTHKLRDCI